MVQKCPNSGHPPAQCPQCRTLPFQPHTSPRGPAQKLDSGTAAWRSDAVHSRPRSTAPRAPGGPGGGCGGPPAPLPSEAERRSRRRGRGGRLAELCERLMGSSGLPGLLQSAAPPALPSCRPRGGLCSSSPLPGGLLLLGCRRGATSAPALRARRSVGVQRGSSDFLGVPAASPSEGLRAWGAAWGLPSSPAPAGRTARWGRRGRCPGSRCTTSCPGAHGREVKDQRRGMGLGGPSRWAGGSFMLRLRLWMPCTEGLASKPPARKGAGGWSSRPGVLGVLRVLGVLLTFLLGGAGVRGAGRGGTGGRGL